MWTCGRSAGTVGTVNGLYARPHTAARRDLPGDPVLESWDAADHPDRLRLRAYLDEVEKRLAGAWPPEQPSAVELVVGLKDDVPLDSGGRDLDNYLYPLARRLDPGRIAAMFGRKVHQQGSTIAVAPAVAFDADEPPLVEVHTSVSVQSLAWKQTIHRACHDAVAEPLPGGPVAVRIQFEVSGRRNWAALWKPAIDALGPVLGTPRPANPFHPADDRIVDLELHRLLNDELAHDVVIRVWATAPQERNVVCPEPTR